MQDNIFFDMPEQYEAILLETKRLSFNMASDLQTGSLLKTLTASRRSGKILELGTGSGLATSWILQGMNSNAHLTTIDNNAMLMEIARQQLKDERIDFILQDGYEWLKTYKGEKFDLIFADAMPGKYDLFDETIALLKTGGLYVIDACSLSQIGTMAMHNVLMNLFRF